MNKRSTNSEYETHNREIINNNFPERMNVLIPCSCGKTFKAQDGHFIIAKNKRFINLLGIKRYKGFSWKCREQEYRIGNKYYKNHPERAKKANKLELKGNKNSLNRTLKSAISAQKKRFPNEICIFKYGGRFPSSLIWKEANEYNKQIIKNLLEQQNYKCALTGDPITELTLSIDRIDSNKGYIEGNIQLTTWEANERKSNFQSDAFIDFCTKVYLHTQSKKSNSESSQDLDLQSTCIPPSESSEILEE